MEKAHCAMALVQAKTTIPNEDLPHVARNVLNALISLPNSSGISSMMVAALANTGGLDPGSEVI